MAMCLTANRAVAENYTVTHSSGTATITLITTSDHKFKVNGTGPEYDTLEFITVNGGTLNVVFDNTASIYLAGAITVTKGTLNLLVGDNCSPVNPTIMRASGNTGHLVFVDASESDAASCRLNIQGEAGKRFIIDGNCHGFDVSGDFQTGFTASHDTTDVEASFALACCHGGTMDLNYVTLQKNWNNSTTGGSASFMTSNDGGAVNVYDEKDAKAISVVTMDSCVIEGCYAYRSGSGIRVRVNTSASLSGTSSVVLNKCVIRNCYTEGQTASMGGVIRTWGTSKCTLEMHGCLVEDNRNNKNNTEYYGVIHWNTGEVDPLILDSCIINHNWSKGIGGGLVVATQAIITNTRITNNKAVEEGGGIYYSTYSRSQTMPNLQVLDGMLSLDENTIIEGNSAKKGGGMYLLVKPIKNGGSTIYVHPNGDTITVSLDVDGAVIKNNTASDDGGGVYMTKQAGTKYPTTINLNYGAVDNNHAMKKGGGIYVEGGVSVNVGSATSDSLKVIRNAAVSGAGIYIKKSDIYVTNGFIGLKDKPNISTGGNGGGIYVDEGDLIMTGGDISYNQAQKSGNNGGNAGAFYVEAGNVVINSGTISHNIAAVNGGAIYALNRVSVDSIVLHGGTVSDNSAAESGGGIYVASGNITIDAGTIASNQAGDSISGADGGFGGGLYLGNGVIDFHGGGVSANKAKQHGGGIYVASGNITIDNGDVASNQAEEGSGGGLYLGDGVIDFHGGSVSNNSAAQSGGGVYVVSGNITMDNGTIASNEAVGGFGGGLYMGGGSMTVSGNNSVFKANHSYNQGGGIHLASGMFTMTGGKIGGTTAEGNYTNINNSNGEGGGLYVGDGTADIRGGVISGNHSKHSGGGIYINGGICTLSEGAIIGGEPNITSNDTMYYTNSSKYGGGIYSADGTITLLGGRIQYNEASDDGGGIYSNGPGVINIQKQNDATGYIEYNTAQNGGGIYAKLGTINFSDGSIQYNSASDAGGGIYVNDEGLLYLKGSATIHRNKVPEGHNGGGVYLKGTVIVGEQVADLGRIKVQENFAGEEYVYTWTPSNPPLPTDSIDRVTANNRNNIFLPQPEVRADHRDVITIIENGISLESRIGFSVSSGFVPVIYCAPSATSHAYLNQFSTGQDYQYMMFDDTRHYVAVHYSNLPTFFDPDHVYLYGFWTNIVVDNPDDPDPEQFNPEAISTREELAYFISWVNGLNGVSPHPNANGKLLEDIDMSQYGWVPIGHLTEGYGGVFDGNGHTVSGIRSFLYREYTDYGFFGKLNGGTVENLFIKDALYVIEDKDDLLVGGIAAEMGNAAVVQNCEAYSTIRANRSSIIMGGLVGRTNFATDTIHSSIGIADMTGYLMGGLVGDNNGVLLNSFANAKFTYDATDNQFFGGLVGENSGKVENCYVRLRGDVPTSDHFGWLVGENESGDSVNYCYTRGESGTPYCASNSGSLNGCGYYANNTQTPYLYARRDNQVVIADNTINSSITNSYVPLDYDSAAVHPSVYATGADKQMMFCLNNWVSANNRNSSDKFTYWQRPTTKVINDDLPVLRMPSVDAVVCSGNSDGTENEVFLNYGDVNVLIADNTLNNTAAIWLYKNKNGIAGNANSAAKLYIAEGVTVLQDPQNPILNAYVGVTLLNKGGIHGAHPVGMRDYTDWHMFSSPLFEAPLGVNYTDDTQYLFSYGHSVDSSNNPMPYYHFYDDEASRGYFPSHRYGTDYGEDVSSPTAGGNYYQEWDYYTYYEPEYHWINFKRNSNSHWHENGPSAPISYNNESTLTRGRGYLLATREETFLQCYGRLNRGEITIPVTYSGHFSPGYNFLGNPYLAYLDFNAFVDVNFDAEGGGLWQDTNGIGYSIIDESTEPAGYKYYAYDGSRNDYGASRYIAPHQGFMIRLTSAPTMDPNAYFDMHMCSLEGDGGPFRDDNSPAYPLVNLFAIDDNNNRAITTVELGRPDRGGAKLMRELKWAKCHVYCRYENEDWTIAFTQPGLTEAAIRFEAYEDGEFTMKWDAENGEFHYLHLIDNMTGVDVDCLAETEYRFAATTEDFRSRFRLVFGYTGVEEEENEGQEVNTFAFQSGDELVVNGEGTLTMYDVTGRAMMNVETYGTQTVTPLPDLAAGVYLLQLDTINGTKVQKIVIK